MSKYSLGVDFEIIDFHTHPFLTNQYNISAYREEYHVSDEDMIKDMDSFGISRFCGAPIDRVNISRQNSLFPFSIIKETNDKALELSEKYKDRYIPGFHISPCFLEESLAEIERMADRGVKLVGELVPYLHAWREYNHEGIYPLLDEIEKRGMILNFHNMAQETIEDMVKSHPNIIFVAAHPGERGEVDRNVSLMKKYDNLYLDLSGTGIFRWPMLRYLVDSVGEDRILFGSDYPTCSPGVYIGGVLGEHISDAAKEKIFSLNAKRLLGL